MRTCTVLLITFFVLLNNCGEIEAWEWPWTLFWQSGWEYDSYDVYCDKTGINYLCRRCYNYKCTKRYWSSEDVSGSKRP